MKSIFVKTAGTLMISLFLISGCQSKEKSGSDGIHTDSLGRDTTKKSGLDQAPLEGSNDGAN